MTRLMQFANNATSRLAATLSAVGTTVTVIPGDGSKFPSLTAGQYFMATLIKADGSKEVVKVTARTSDTMTIVRAAEAVGGVQTAYSFNAADRIDLRLTAGELASELDRLDRHALTGVLNKSANYTAVEADASNLIRVDSTAAACTITLPQISTLTEDFIIAVSKVSGDNNAVYIAGSGGNTINGTTPYALVSQWQGAWLVADRSTNTWTAVSSGIGSSFIFVDKFTGTGAQTAFTLTAGVYSSNQVDVTISGVTQNPGIDYTATGTTLTFTSAPPNATVILARYTQSAPQVTTGTCTTERQVATLGQTGFALANGYIPGSNTMQVFVNGLLLTLGTDYTETGTNAVTFTSGLSTGDEVQFVVYGKTVSAADSGNVGYSPAGTGAVATTVQSKLRESVSVKDFGAVGDGSQTLFATSYQTDITTTPTTITQQTADALAINKALVYLRSIGGGKLHFPKGVYRVWGYLERIDFPCLITGDGVDQSIIENCDTSPTNTNGYGIFCVDTTLTSQSEVGFQNLTLDGNAVVRSLPTSEFRSYPLAFYGAINAKLSNIKCINSSIDCLYTNYANAVTSSLQAVNCTFDNAFRNTVSLVGGWNQSFVNCDITGGGKVQGGTNPKYCIDIEPNLSSNPIKNIKLTNCSFSNAENVLAGGVWNETVFENCNFLCTGSAVAGYPWAFNFAQSQVTLQGCKIRGGDELRNTAKSYNTYVTGEYKDTQYLKIIGCEFYGCGMHIIGRRTFIQDTSVMNSRYPVLIESSTAYRHEVYINDLTLINVIDVFNAGAGTSASFAIKSTVEGPVIIDGLTLEIDPLALPASPSFSYALVYGMYISTTGLSTAEMKVSNVHVSGYYQKYPNATGQALNTGNFRDWGTPNLPPADTAGQTAGPGAAYYRNCTMYGNAA